MQTLLLLDDDSDTISLLKSYLESSGFQVITFQSCLAAMEFLTESPKAVDLVLSDLHMPDAPGTDLLTALREIDARTPFLIMTAQKDFDASLVSELGGQGVLYKPLNGDVVIDRVRAALRELRDR